MLITQSADFVRKRQRLGVGAHVARDVVRAAPIGSFAACCIISSEMSLPTTS